jgi:ParB-like chromosome segregation protein Spo0J
VSLPNEIHPVADLFPMLAADELAELSADINERGLLQPVVLDVSGRVLDGRNRLAACALAGVEPEFVTYDGPDPDGYALAVNIARRHLTSGARAIIAAKAARLSGKSTRESAAETNLFPTLDPDGD